MIVKQQFYLWIARIAAWASQTLNLFLLFGHHDQTISARCYVNRNELGWRCAHALVNWIFSWEPNHCRKSFERDVEFAKEVLSHLDNV